MSEQPNATSPSASGTPTIQSAPSETPTSPSESSHGAWRILDVVLQEVRRTGIVRRKDNQWVAGVCSGIAQRLGIDPVLVRVGLIVASIVAGAGVFIYLAGWLLLPDAQGRIALERAVRESDPGSIVLSVFFLISLFGTLSDSRFAIGPLVALAIGFFLWRRHRTGSPLPSPTQGPIMTTTTSSPPVTNETVSPDYSGGATPPPYSPRTLPPHQGSAPLPTAPRRAPRRTGGWPVAILSLGAAMLAAQGARMWYAAANSGADVPNIYPWAGALAMLGVILVALGLKGFRGGLVTVMSIVALVGLAQAAGPEPEQVQGSYRPTSLAQVESTYRASFGKSVVDLRGVTLPDGGQKALTISAHFGSVDLTVPSDLTVKIVNDARFGEVREVTGSTKTKLVDGTTTLGEGIPDLVVTTDVRFGELNLIRQ